MEMQPENRKLCREHAVCSPWGSDIGSAAAGADFTEMDETQTFMPADFSVGATTVAKTCSVPIIDDDLDESHEQVSMLCSDGATC